MRLRARLIASLGPLLVFAGCLLGAGSSKEGDDGGGAGGAGGQAGGWVQKPPPNLAPLPPPLEPAEVPGTDVVLTVRSDGALFALPPAIYGWNSWDPRNPFDPASRPDLVRFGGNRLTAYNWENNASNAGRDYMHQNDGLLSPEIVPGAAAKSVVEGARTVGAAVVLTVPIVDHVAADRMGGGDVMRTPDYLATRFRRNKPRNDVPAATPDTSDDSVYQSEFVAWAKGAFPEAPILFSLDNEPDLWAATHPRIHPMPPTYDEVVTRNVDYAKAVKDVWPTAGVLGFVSYGYQGYVSLQNAPDAAGKGLFLEYYLAKMKEAEVAAGKRLVDYVDLHWYPEARGGATRIVFQTNDTEEVVEARLQAPRSLWDKEYTESSWIAQVRGGPIALLPWVRDIVARTYPGTKLAVTEWNYGGANHVSGAVATADVLGIFGREGVELAAIWALAGAEPYTQAGLKAYTNYDGQGGHFGDVGVPATTSDKVTSSVYASVSSADPNRVILVVINKAKDTKTAALRVAHPKAFSRASVWTVTAAGPALAPGAPLAPVGQNAFSYPMPGRSVSVLRLE